MAEEAEIVETPEVMNPDNMRPDWHLDKFETVEAQAKAYKDLDKLHGEKMTEFESLKKTNEEFKSKFGAPEAYEYPTIEGIEWDESDPMLVGFKELAKNSDMPQEKFNEYLEMYAANQAGMREASEQEYKEEIAKIQNFESRKKNIEDWLSANLPNHADGFEALATDAKSFAALEALLEKAGKAPASPKEYASMNVPSMDEIRAMQMAVDENGQRKMRDPEYAAKVRKLMSMHVGTGEFQEFVG